MLSLINSATKWREDILIFIKNTCLAVCSIESSATDTTKTFTGESSLTGAIVQTWAAATKILLRERKQNLE